MQRPVRARSSQLGECLVLLRRYQGLLARTFARFEAMTVSLFAGKALHTGQGHIKTLGNACLALSGVECVSDTLSKIEGKGFHGSNVSHRQSQRKGL